MRNYYNLDCVGASRSFRALDTVTTWKYDHQQRVIAIDAILEAKKYDRRYYLAKYYRIFDGLDKKIWAMLKNGEVDRKTFERFHSTCIYHRQNYLHALRHLDED